MLDKLSSIGNATSLPSESGFLLIVLSKLISVEEVTFSESMRLKLEDRNLDLRMKWIPVGEGKNPVLANEKRYCQISAGREQE